jgi:hypothetical protein
VRKCSTSASYKRSLAHREWILEFQTVVGEQSPAFVGCASRSIRCVVEYNRAVTACSFPNLLSLSPLCIAEVKHHFTPQSRCSHLRGRRVLYSPFLVTRRKRVFWHQSFSMGELCCATISPFSIPFQSQEPRHYNSVEGHETNNSPETSPGRW